jgi:hypothetical protein
MDGDALVGPMGQRYAFLLDASPQFAERVCEAINAHDAMVAALEQITRTPALSNGALLMQDIARAAIARAKGE